MVKNVNRTARLQWKVDTIKNCIYLQCILNSRKVTPGNEAICKHLEKNRAIKEVSKIFLMSTQKRSKMLENWYLSMYLLPLLLSKILFKICLSFQTTKCDKVKVNRHKNLEFTRAMPYYLIRPMS